MAKEKDQVVEENQEDEVITAGDPVATVTEEQKPEPEATPEPKVKQKPADSDGGSAASVPEESKKPVTVEELLVAVRYLAGRVSSNAEMAELRQAFPRVFD